MGVELPAEVIAPAAAALVAAVVAYLAVPNVSRHAQNVFVLAGFAALMAMAVYIALRNTVL